MDLFEVRYLESWAYRKELCRWSIRSRPKLILRWCMLTALGAGCLVWNVHLGVPWMMAANVLLVGFILFRGFIYGPIKVRTNWNKSKAIFRKEEWEVCIRFGKDVQMEANGTLGVKVGWDLCTSVVDRGERIKLYFRNGLAPMIIKKSEFVRGTAEEFMKWLADTYPNIRQIGHLK